MEGALETSPAVVAAVFCSRAEVHDVLQAASWLQQLGQHQHDQPLQGAIIGLAQESSRRCGLQRMRLLLVRHSCTTLADNVLLQDSSTQLSCCGSTAAGQDVAVTLEALVEQLPPGSSAAAVTCCATSSISSACWQSAVKQMQREVPVLCTKQQIGRVMLRLALYYHAHQLLQPMQQLLATHGHSFTSLAPLLQYAAAESCSDQDNTAALLAVQQHLQGVDLQVAQLLLQKLTEVQQLLQQFAAPVPEEVMLQLHTICASAASSTPASSPTPPSAAVAAAGGATPDELPPLQLSTSSSKRTASAECPAQRSDAKRARHAQHLPPQQLLQEVHEEAGFKDAAPLGSLYEQQGRTPPADQPQPQQQQQGSVEQQWLGVKAEQQQVESTAVRHACSPLQEASSSGQLLQGLQEDFRSEEQCDASRYHTAAAQGQQVAAASLAGPAAGSEVGPHGVALPCGTVLLLVEAAAALKAAHGRCCVPLEAWLTAGSGAALASRLGGSVAAAAAFLQSWPQVFVVLQTRQDGQGSTGTATSVGLQNGAERWLFQTGHGLQLVSEFRAALLRAAMRGRIPSAFGAAPGVDIQFAIRIMPRQLAPYRKLYSKFTLFLEAAGLLQHFELNYNGSHLLLKHTPSTLPPW